MADERLEQLADLLDENPSAIVSLSSVSGLKDSLRTRPVRGVACTRDGELAVIATGDGRFELYRTAVELHLGTGHLAGSGSRSVLRDPTRVVSFATSQDRRRPERMACHLFPPSPDQKSGCERVERLTHIDRLSFSLDGQQLAIWREDLNRLSVIDLTTGNERATSRWVSSTISTRSVSLPTGQAWHLEQLTAKSNCGICAHREIPTSCVDTVPKKHGPWRSRRTGKRSLPPEMTFLSDFGIPRPAEKGSAPRSPLARIHGRVLIRRAHACQRQLRHPLPDIDHCLGHRHIEPAFLYAELRQTRPLDCFSP